MSETEQQPEQASEQLTEEQVSEQPVTESSVVEEAKTDSDESADKTPQSRQGEMPFALIQGQPMTQLPLDLYIPPDALEVILEQFEGPLDLLLYLIRKQNLDILEVNVAEITEQYMGYIHMMDAMQLELAGEYLVMAAMLAEIKSRVLLPRNNEGEEEEEADPRAELIRRLQEYERFKKAAEDLDEIPRLERDHYVADVDAPDKVRTVAHPEVDMKELLLAMGAIMRRAEMFEKHEVKKEVLSTRSRMTTIMEKIRTGTFVNFGDLFTPEEGRNGVVVTFLAMLELIKESLVDIVQHDVFGPIHVRARVDGPGHIDSILASEFDNEEETAASLHGDAFETDSTGDYSGDSAGDHQAGEQS